MSRPCAACASCYMEPSDMDLICGHERAGIMGKYVRVARAPGAFCGPDASLFRQHPLRGPDGSLKP